VPVFSGYVSKQRQARSNKTSDEGEATMMGMRTRVGQDGITAEAVMTDPPAYAWDEDEPQRDRANWYRVTLGYDGRTMTVPFGMGSALTDEPNAADVINCLASDAATFENARSFEEWASELGFDSDSRRAYAIYQQTETQTTELRGFLGEQYDAYLWDTEGL
jgi:hypothetical protein